MTEAVLRIPGSLLVNASCDPDRAIRTFHEQALQNRLLPSSLPAEDAAQIWVRGLPACISRAEAAAFPAAVSCTRTLPTPTPFCRLLPTNPAPRNHMPHCAWSLPSNSPGCSDVPRVAVFILPVQAQVFALSDERSRQALTAFLTRKRRFKVIS